MDVHVIGIHNGYICIMDTETHPGGQLGCCFLMRVMFWIWRMQTLPAHGLREPKTPPSSSQATLRYLGHVRVPLLSSHCYTDATEEWWPQPPGFPPSFCPISRGVQRHLSPTPLQTEVCVPISLGTGHSTMHKSVSLKDPGAIDTHPSPVRQEAWAVFSVFPPTRLLSVSLPFSPPCPICKGLSISGLIPGLWLQI